MWYLSILLLILGCPDQIEQTEGKIISIVCFLCSQFNVCLSEMVNKVVDFPLKLNGKIVVLQPLFKKQMSFT